MPSARAVDRLGPPTVISSATRTIPDGTATCIVTSNSFNQNPTHRPTKSTKLKLIPSNTVSLTADRERVARTARRCSRAHPTLPFFPSSGPYKPMEARADPHDVPRGCLRLTPLAD